jgi:hypothetical protein
MGSSASIFSIGESEEELAFKRRQKLAEIKKR